MAQSALVRGYVSAFFVFAFLYFPSQSSSLRIEENFRSCRELNKNSDSVARILCVCGFSEEKEVTSTLECEMFECTF